MYSSDYLTRLQQRMVALDEAAYHEFADLVAVLAWERVKANGFAGPEAGRFAKDCSWRLAARIRDLSGAPVLALEEWLSGELDAALRQWFTELARDVLDAGRVQADLMPNRRLTAAGLEIASQSRPARVVTGDLHDVFELPDSRILMALGDASGHGAAAGLYSSVGLALLRTTLSKVEGPAAILRSLNQALAGCGACGRYMTLSLALWERASGQLRFANAGGKAASMIRGGRSVRVEVPGQWLGWFPEADYEEIVVAVQPDDLVVLNSDGITDQENPAGIPYEEDSLGGFLAACSGLPALEVTQGVLIDVERFADGQPQEDDQTILVAKVL